MRRIMLLSAGLLALGGDLGCSIGPGLVGWISDWRAALAIGMIEPVFQTLAFAIHERVWARLGAPAQA